MTTAKELLSPYDLLVVGTGINEVVDDVDGVLGTRLGWDAAQRAEEVADYRRWLERLAVPDPAGPRSSSFGAGAVGPGRR